MKFAKLFELGEYQVLLTVRYDSERERHILTVESGYDDTIIGMEAAYKEEYKALRAMGSYSENEAKKFLVSVKDAVKKLDRIEKEKK